MGTPHFSMPHFSTPHADALHGVSDRDRMHLDTSWYRDVNIVARDTPWAHAFLAAYALWGGLVCLALLLVAEWWRARRRDDAPHAVATAGIIGAATIVALLVNQHLLSPAIARQRPCHALAHVETLLSCNGDYSMPSDHCIIAGAFAAGLLVLHRRTGLVAGLLALLLAFARVYVGVHYPADAACGLAAGAVIALLLVVALRGAVTRLAAWLATTPLRPLIVASTGPPYAAQQRHPTDSPLTK